MLTCAVQTYLSVRQATGFCLEKAEGYLRSFAAYSDAKGQRYVTCQTAIEWARQVPAMEQRARRLGDVIRFARYMHAEDVRHEIPAAVFGSEHRPRRPPYILSDEQNSSSRSTCSGVGIPYPSPRDLQHSVRAAVLYRPSCFRGYSVALRRHHAGWTGDPRNQIPEVPAGPAA